MRTREREGGGNKRGAPQVCPGHVQDFLIPRMYKCSWTPSFLKYVWSSFSSWSPGDVPGPQLHLRLQVAKTVFPYKDPTLSESRIRWSKDQHLDPAVGQPQGWNGQTIVYTWSVLLPLEPEPRTPCWEHGRSGRGRQERGPRHIEPRTLLPCPVAFRLTRHHAWLEPLFPVLAAWMLTVFGVMCRCLLGGRALEPPAALVFWCHFLLFKI